jgi:ATP-dependent Clp protease ATP-binding subunit ClpB
MEERLKQRVIGQDEGISAVSSALRRARSGLQDPNGPSVHYLPGADRCRQDGTGRALAEFMFDNEQAMIRIDMFRIYGKARCGAPDRCSSGYVGYEKAVYLTGRREEASYAVLLFDEIEKAHPDVFNILCKFWMTDA